MGDTDDYAVFREANLEVISEENDSGAILLEPNHSTQYYVDTNVESMLRNSEIKVEDVQVPEVFSYQTMMIGNTCRTPLNGADTVYHSGETVMFGQVKNEYGSDKIKSEREPNLEVTSEENYSSAISRQPNHSLQYSVDTNDESMLGNSEIKVEDVQVAEVFSYQTIRTEDTCRTPLNGADPVYHSGETVMFGQVKNEYDSDKIKSESMEIVSEKWNGVDFEENSTVYKENILLLDTKDESNKGSVSSEVMKVEKISKSIRSNLKKHKCPLCDYSSNIKKKLRRHIAFFHLDLKNFKCHLCVYAADSKNSLKYHINSVHLNLKNFNCHICGYVAKRKGTLRYHTHSVHFNLKNFKCYLCNYAANRKVCLKKHIECVHLNLKNFKCYLCNYASYRKHDLKAHIDSIHLNLRKS